MSLNDFDSELFAARILLESGYVIMMPDELRRLHRIGRPNHRNLTDLENNASERLFAADGLPLLGIFPDSYEHAPLAYARELIQYPRSDSPSRSAGTAQRATYNVGAEAHLKTMYPKMMRVLRALAQAEHQRALEGTGPEWGSKESALNIVNGAISTWSYMVYKNGDHIKSTEIPAEVGLLARSISGVRMSLLRLFMHGDFHAQKEIFGWQNDEFTADSWLRATEESGVLVGEVTDPPQVCVAPYAMIRNVMETIVEGPRPGAEVADMISEFGVDPVEILTYGEVWFDLEQNRDRYEQAGSSFMNNVAQHIEDKKPHLTVEWLRELREAAMESLGTIPKDLIAEINRGFLECVEALGYRSSQFPQYAPAPRILGRINPQEY